MADTVIKIQQNMWLVKGRFILLFLLLCFLTPPSISFANTERTITTEQWQKLTNDKAFGYKNDKEKVKEPKEYKPNGFAKFMSALFAFFNSEAWLGLAWIAAISIVAYIIYKLFLGKDSILFGRRRRSLKEGVPAQEEEDLALTNWETLMQRAISNNDVRLAVRYSYMRLLQLLQEHELILYRNDKTNYEYYTELSDTSYKQPFRQLSRQYEYTWYGNYNLSPEAYNEYMSLFNNLKNQLGA